MSTLIASIRLENRRKWDKKCIFCKNEPEKLLKTKDRHLKMGQNEPENEAENLLKTKGRGKNEPENCNRKSQANLLKINGGKKSCPRQIDACPRLVTEVFKQIKNHAGLSSSPAELNRKSCRDAPAKCSITEQFFMPLICLSRRVASAGVGKSSASYSSHGLLPIVDGVRPLLWSRRRLLR